MTFYTATQCISVLFGKLIDNIWPPIVLPAKDTKYTSKVYQIIKVHKILGLKNYGLLNKWYVCGGHQGK